MSEPSQLEIKRWAMDASDWLWGTVQGAWNEKQTVSQIIVDAVIGMIPLVGDVTAARDLIAVGTRLADDPQKREEVAEWVLLVVLIFALIPVIGGVIKGVGRLLLKLGKNAAENHKILQEVVEFLNRVGHGDAVKFIKELNLLKYQSELIAKFNAFMDKLVEALRAIKSRLSWMLSNDMQQMIDRWVSQFGELKRLGSKMIPQALKDLNERLKLLQQAVYKGELHTVQVGTKNVTRESEARLVDEHAAKPKSKKAGWPQNKYEDYQHVEGWPDLRKRVKKIKGKPDSYEAIEAFSGAVKAVALKGPKTIYRVLRPKGLEDGTNSMASPWWTETLPPNGKVWREEYAVLDDFNKNSYYIEYTIPTGHEMKAWKGKASEQFSRDSGQHLPGGGEQLYVDLSAEVRQIVESLPLKPTGWGETSGVYGFDKTAAQGMSVRTEKLATHEIERKTAMTNSKTVAGTRAYAANERAKETTQ